MRISDWSSDVCSSDLGAVGDRLQPRRAVTREVCSGLPAIAIGGAHVALQAVVDGAQLFRRDVRHGRRPARTAGAFRCARIFRRTGRSEEHTSELQSLMRISYAVFCLKKKNTNKHTDQ